MKTNNNLTRDKYAAVSDGMLVPFETDTAAPYYQIVSVERTLRLFLPSNRDKILSLQFKDDNGKYKAIGKSKPLTRVVDVLFHKIYTRDLCKFTKEKGFPFPTEMANLIAKDTNLWIKIKKPLKEAGYLIDDESWCNGYKSLYFSFGPEMDGIKFEPSPTPITVDMPYYIHGKNLDKKEKYKIMRTSIDSSLTIDKELLTKVFPHIAAKKKWSFTEQIKQFNYLNEEFHCFYSICSTGRMFGGWSSVERELRGTFLIDGEPAVEVDIACAQPTLLTALYPDRTSPEYLKLKKVVEGGLFYEWVMKYFKDDYKDKDLRDEYKVEVMTFLCGQFKNRIRAFFDEKLPELMSVMMEKRDKHKDVSQKDAHKVIGRELQRIESDIIVKMVCEKYPEVYSLHDGVICHPKIAEEVRNYIEEVLLATTDIRGKITIECKRDNLLKYDSKKIEEVAPIEQTKNEWTLSDYKESFFKFLASQCKMVFIIKSATG